ICNAGSSSIKFSLLEAREETLLFEADIEWASSSASLTVRRGAEVEHKQPLTLRNHEDAVAQVLSILRTGPSAPLQSLDEIHAVGNRVVHGGDKYQSAVRITPEVRQEISRLAELAPLHNIASSQVISAVTRLLPETPQVAAFDTAFHSTLSES